MPNIVVYVILGCAGHVLDLLKNEFMEGKTNLWSQIGFVLHTLGIVIVFIIHISIQHPS